MSDPRSEDDYQALREEVARSLRRSYEQAERWRRGDFTIVPREEPGDRQGEATTDDGFVVHKMTAYVPISEEHAMDLGLIPDTRPAPPPPTRRQRARAWVRRVVREARWRLAAKIGGADRDHLEEISSLW